jgi:hypothetical protein
MFYIIFVLLILLIIFLKLQASENFSNIYIIDANYCDQSGKCLSKSRVRAILQYYASVVNSINITSSTFGGDPSPGYPKICSFSYYNSKGNLITQTLAENSFYSF